MRIDLKCRNSIILQKFHDNHASEQVILILYSFERLCLKHISLDRAFALIRPLD